MAMHTITIAFNLDNRLDALERLNREVAAFRSRANLTEKCFHEVNLALEEIFVNFVHHAHQDGALHTMHVTLALAQNVLTIITEDDGIAFNPQTAALPDVRCPLEQRQIGGLGIMLIKRVMDTIHYERRDGKNRTTYTKSILEESGCDVHRRDGS